MKTRQFKHYVLFHDEKECPVKDDNYMSSWWEAEARHYANVKRGDTSRYRQLLKIFKHDSPELFPKDYSQTNKEVIAWVINEIYTFSGGYEQAKEYIDNYRRQFLIVKYCRYYDNEKECPFKEYTSEFHFWHFEKMYIFSVGENSHGDFEKYALDYIECHKDEKNFLTSNAPLFQKGFVMYAEAMLEKWMPYDVDIIFDYGKIINMSHLKLHDGLHYSEEEEQWLKENKNKVKPERITPLKIDKLADNEIFVFGSNFQGKHLGGAARAAKEKFGAVMGIGEGLQGHSYAIPTMEGLKDLKIAVDRFISFANQHEEDYKFFVTPIGCGKAGYKPEDVAPMFFKATSLSNVMLPLPFWRVLLEKKSLYAHELDKAFDHLIAFNNFAYKCTERWGLEEVKSLVHSMESSTAWALGKKVKAIPSEERCPDTWGLPDAIIERISYALLKNTAYSPFDNDIPTYLINETQTPDPVIRLFRMVQELHRRGYQKIRLCVSIPPTGFGFRCFITYKANCWNQCGVMPGLTSGPDTAYFESGMCPWGNENMNYEEMASIFLKKCKKIAKYGKGEDPEFVKWFDKAVNECLHGHVFYVMDDYYCCIHDKKIKLTGRTDATLPFPSPGETDLNGIY